MSIETLIRMRDSRLAHKAGQLPHGPIFPSEAFVELVDSLLDTQYRLARLEEALLSFLNRDGRR